MALLDQEKTEAPTPRRRDEAKREGRIPRSAELTTSFVLLGAALILNAAGPYFGRELLAIFHLGLASLGTLAPDDAASLGVLRDLGWRTLGVLALWGSSLMVIAILIAGPQARGVLSTKPITPDFERLSPAKNLKRIVGTQGLVELLKSVIKLVLVASLVRMSLAAVGNDVTTLTELSPLELLLVIKGHAVRMLMTAGLAYLGLAALDYIWQVWQHEQSLRMSRDEIKQELKQTEGDPLVKQRLRSFGRALARRQMFRSVPSADLVITNPTHIAVALRYDPDAAPAPIVIAMGQRKVAERIKALAHQHGVPIIENKPLARALLASARVGSMIPAELYVAVAEILAFVIRRRMARGAPLRQVFA